MKILLVPMQAAGQTDGPFSRVRTLAETFLERGTEVALCIGDINCMPVNGAKNYQLTPPTLMGLPSFIGTRTFPIADRLGLIGKKEIRSFEEVLHITGALTYPYLKQSVMEIRDAIRQFRPDVVYSEFNISAVIAARTEGVPIAGSYSYPVQPEYASSPQFAGGCNRLLKELGQPEVRSTLELFSHMDLLFVPSSHELEPIEDGHVSDGTVPESAADGRLQFVGPLKRPTMLMAKEEKPCIPIYMGIGAVGSAQLRKTICAAFCGAPYEIYLSGMTESRDEGNIHMARRFDFSTLLPSAIAFIHHGGQNSVMDGLLYGVPQLIYPGRIFERKYNAESVKKCRAAIVLESGTFCAESIAAAVRELVSDKTYHENAAAAGNALLSLGGAAAVADRLMRLF